MASASLAPVDTFCASCPEKEIKLGSLLISPLDNAIKAKDSGCGFPPFVQPRIYNASVSDLRGKTVFITGGARRLGRAIALAMAQSGANVAFTFRCSANEAGETLKEIKAAGVQALAIECDFRQQDSAGDAVKNVLKYFGRIDLLIN